MQFKVLTTTWPSGGLRLVTGKTEIKETCAEQELCSAHGCAVN